MRPALAPDLVVLVTQKSRVVDAVLGRLRHQSTSTPTVQPCWAAQLLMPVVHHPGLAGRT